MPDFPPPNIGRWPAPTRAGGLPKLVLARRRPSVAIAQSEMPNGSAEANGHHEVPNGRDVSNGHREVSNGHPEVSVPVHQDHITRKAPPTGAAPNGHPVSAPAVELEKSV